MEHPLVQVNVATHAYIVKIVQPVQNVYQDTIWIIQMHANLVITLAQHAQIIVLHTAYLVQQDIFSIIILVSNVRVHALLVLFQLMHVVVVSQVLH